MWLRSYQKRGGNKYGAKPQVVDGIRYDSGAEGKRAGELEILKKAKEIKDWKRQITLPLCFGEYKITGYRIDFVVFEKDGSITLEEIKGMELYAWQLKWKLLEAILDHDCLERRKIYEVIGAKNKNTEVKMSLIKN